MIQFNLLPDVKLEYVKVQRTKHTVISASLIAAGSACFIFLLFFLTVHVLQRNNISDLNGDIKKYSGQLKATPDLDKILTIQSQLSQLTALHADKAAVGRSFDFIKQVTPSSVSLSDMTIDYAANTVIFTGQSSGLDQVNTFIDTLKFTTFTNTTVKDPTKAFTDVVMSQFTRTSTKSTGGSVFNGTTFTITANFNSIIFDNADNVTLAVPNKVSTRSVVEQPTDIFKAAPTTTTNGNAN